MGKVNSVKIIAALILLVGISAVFVVALNIDNGDDFNKTEDVGVDVTISRDDTSKKIAEDSYMEPKGVKNEETSGGQTGRSSNMGYSASNKVNVFSGSNAKKDDVSMNNDKDETIDTISDSGPNKNNVTETEDEQIRREETEREAYLEQLKASQDNYYDVSWVQNSYYWKDKCPENKNMQLSVYDGYTLGGYICESVSYAAWMVYKYYGIPINWGGSANNWDDVARINNYTVSHTPSAKTIGQIETSNYGHVFWVERVNADGSIVVSEYNNSYSTEIYSGDNHSRDFGARIISAAEAVRYNYIYLKK